MGLNKDACRGTPRTIPATSDPMQPSKPFLHPPFPPKIGCRLRRFVLPIRWVSVILPIRSGDLLVLLGF